MEDKINSVVDTSATSSELDKLYNQIYAVFQLIKQLNQEGAKINLSQGVSEGVAAAQAAKAATEQLRQSREALKAQEDAVKVSIAQSRLEQQQANTETAQARAAVAALNAERAKSKPQVQAEAGSLIDLRNKLNEARKAYDALGESARNASSGKNLLAVVQSLNNQVSQIEQSTGRFQRNVGNYPTQILGGLGEGLGSILSVAGLAGLTGGVVGLGEKLFETTREVGAMNQSLMVVSKTAQEFGNNQRFLSETSDRLGLNVIDLTNSFKAFYAASTLSGLSAQTTRKLFEEISGVSANLHLSQENTNTVFEGFSKILSKGTVDTRDLRDQIGRAIPGAFELAAKSIGVTTGELNKMLAKGQLAATDFLPKFAAALDTAYGPEKGAKIESLNASINRLSNSFTSLVQDNESGLTKFFKLIVDLAGEALSEFNELAEGVAYSLQKVFDPKAAQELIQNSALKETAKQYAKDTNEVLLEVRNNIDKNIEIVQNRIQGEQTDLDIGKKQNSADPAVKAFLASVQAQLDKDKAELELLNKNRDLAVSELQKRFPETITPTAPKELTDAQKAAAARLAELRIKADADADKAELQQQIDQQKRILDNDQLGYGERLQALDTYYNLKQKLAAVDTEAQKKEIQQQIAINKAVPEQLKAIDAQAALNTEKNQTEEANYVVKITKQFMDERTRAITAGYEATAIELDKQQNKEQEQVTQFYAEGKITAEQYEAEKLRIKNKYDILTVQSELELQQQILDVMKAAGVPVQEQYNKIAQLRLELDKLELENSQNVEKAKTEAATKALKARQELQKQEIDMSKQLAKESISTIFSIFDAQYDAQKQSLQEQSDALDKESQKEIDAINASTASEQDKADKIASINARTQAQKDQLAARQKQVDEQKARFDRLKNISDIIAQTAVNVVKVFPNPVLIALAAAIGAAQLAQVLASPIPKYRTGAGVNGRAAHPGGLMQINDGGKLEVVKEPHKEPYIVPYMNAVLNAPSGTKVYPSEEQFLNNQGAFHKPMRVMAPDVQTLHMGEVLGKHYAAHTGKLIEALEANRSQVNVVNTYGGLLVTQKKTNALQQFINREIHT
jgi:tape measure domain-containing protein